MKKSNTMGDYIYETLREEINNLTISPGEKISEYKLAERFKISRAPIKSALLKLEKEGLVKIKPQVGTIVSPISLKKVLDIIEIRMLLEPHAAEIAAPEISQEILEKIEEHLDLVDKAEGREKERMVALFQADNLIHHQILVFCGNEEIHKIIDEYKSEIHRIRLSTFQFVDGFMPDTEELRALHSALKHRSPKEAREMMHRHLLHIKEALEKIPESIFSGTDKTDKKEIGEKHKWIY